MASSISLRAKRPKGIIPPLLLKAAAIWGRTRYTLRDLTKEVSRIYALNQPDVVPIIAKIDAVTAEWQPVSEFQGSWNRDRMLELPAGPKGQPPEALRTASRALTANIWKSEGESYEDYDNRRQVLRTRFERQWIAWYEPAEVAMNAELWPLRDHVNDLARQPHKEAKELLEIPAVRKQVLAVAKHAQSRRDAERTPQELPPQKRLTFRKDEMASAGRLRLSPLVSALFGARYAYYRVQDVQVACFVPPLTGSSDLVGAVEVEKRKAPRGKPTYLANLTLRYDWDRRVPEDLWIVEKRLILDGRFPPTWATPGQSYPARWLGPGRGNQLEVVDGFIVVVAPETYKLVDTQEDAKKLLRPRRHV